jgi:hypothetical protein
MVNKTLTNLFLRFLSAGREVLTEGSRESDSMNQIIIMYKQTVAVADIFVLFESNNPARLTGGIQHAP